MAFRGASVVAKRKNPLPFDKQGGVVAMQRRLLTSDAYRSISPYAKSLLHLMHVHWANDKPVGFGVREAEQTVPCCRRTAMRAFSELTEAGFIVLVDESIFCSRTQSKARTWRLTWMPYNSKKPSLDWERQDAI